MADLGISIVEKLIEVVGSEIIKEICELWGYKSQLEDLHKTVTTIKNVLLDADAKRELSHEQQGYIRELKNVVYDADDLFDQFLTLVEMNQIDRNKAGKFITYKVCRFFSSNRKKLGQAYKTSRQVKDIKKKLDAIADNHTKFGLSLDYKPICRRREETCSYVDAKYIIGRDEDKEKIINRLLDPKGKDDFFVVTIVGVGGLGKTALAQLVYNDDKVRKEFETLLWVCVSDQDGEQFDVKVILCKILELLTANKFDSSCTMELVKKQFEERLSGKKYLLVLDDLWNEDRKKWVDLETFLKWGHVSSRILVTTRSNITASITVDKHAHTLEGLSKEDSWRLFEMSAFAKGYEDENRREFDGIGRMIVEKCCCNPLAIKVVGSLLFGQGINKWRLFAESGLEKIDMNGDKILSILKYSYYNLEPSLRSCFSYCALFPKDSELRKEMLFSLWMAQGYIMPLYGEQSIEDVADEYFSILLQRCFFQDAIKDEYGEVKFVKIHDLMHDIAQHMGRDEICVVDFSCHKDESLQLEDKIRHVHYVNNECQNKSSSRSKIRSFFNWEYETKPFVDIEKWVCLRVLHSRLTKTSLNSLGKLLHLRYLDLSYTMDLDVLPDSITKLHNLQTFILNNCYRLRELPKELCKLAKLRYLDLERCRSLTHMPCMDKLTNLRVLPLFVVGCGIATDKQSDGELKFLKVLAKIRGEINILIHKNFENNYVEKIANIGDGYLSKMEHLKGVTITLDTSSKFGNHETLLENMDPHENLKSFMLCGYEGSTIPRRLGRGEDDWAISLPHLVHVHLKYCIELLEIPVLSKLRHLKSLELSELTNLEFIEKRSNIEATIFFPSLQSLVISSLRKLRGWWNDDDNNDDDDNLSKTKFQFFHLIKLKIARCSNLVSFPPCPSLEELKIGGNNKRLQIMVHTADDVIKLQGVIAENVGYLRSMPAGCITNLRIEGDDEAGRLSEYGEGVFKSHASFLKEVSIWNCNNLRKLSEIRGLKHLTALQSLTLMENLQLGIEEEDDEPWKSFRNSMRFLFIDSCPSLKSFPKELQNITSLRTLRIKDCPDLEKHWEEPNGEDFPIVKHIPERLIIKSKMWFRYR